MSNQEIELVWHGPFRWYGTGDEALFSQPVVQMPGVYLWTVPIEGGLNVVYYVGESGVSFDYRLTEHTRCYLSGDYHVYDLEEFARGRRVMNWEGRMNAPQSATLPEFLSRYHELGPQIYRMLGMFKVYLAPLQADKRVRRRIEGAIARSLYGQDGLAGQFQEKITYWFPLVNEEPILVKMKFPEPILGMSDELLA